MPDVVLKRGRSSKRRGSIYVLALSTTLIIAVLAVAAITTVRIQRRQTQDMTSMRCAELYARAAIDMAMHRMINDSNWRSRMAQGDWSHDQPIGNGYYSFTATDPVDGNLTNKAGDPVVITGTGKWGAAIQRLQARIEVTRPGLSCLEAGIHSGGDLLFEQFTARSSRFISSNSNVRATQNAIVHADAQAQNQVLEENGGSISGSKTNGASSRAMPDSSSVFDYYTMNGTFINVGDLPLWNTNQLQNSGAENLLIAPWASNGSCTLSFDAVHTKSGLKSLSASQRGSASDGPSQVVTAAIASGVTYHVELWVFVTGTGNDDDFRIGLKTNSSGSGLQSATTVWTPVTSQLWTRVQGDLNVSWTGVLNEAVWYVETQTNNKSFCIDEAVLQDADARAGFRIIQREVLSPSRNPFGAGLTNSKGIYVVNCGGAGLSIRRSRILGTLVLLNMANESAVEGSVCWEPAVATTDPNVDNMPCLLTDSPIRLKSTTIALDEGQANANFNPSGTPYQGIANADKQNVYPSQMHGIIYSSNTITVSGSPKIYGMLIGMNGVTSTGTAPASNVLDVRYQPIYFELNAPPGFRDGLRYQLVPGSFRKVVD